MESHIGIALLGLFIWGIFVRLLIGLVVRIVFTLILIGAVLWALGAFALPLP